MKKILENLEEAQLKYNEAIASIKGLSEYSVENQKILIKNFSKKDLKQFVKMDKALRRGRILKVAGIFIAQKVFLAISNDGKCFQVTNHNLYTLIKEENLNLSDFEIIKK